MRLENTVSMLCQETDGATKQDAIYTIQFIQNFQDSYSEFKISDSKYASAVDDLQN